MKKIGDINRKIKKGKARILTANQFVKLTEEKGISYAYKNVDIVTTATFAPMCSSGAILNFKQPEPPMRMEKIYLDGVNAYGGLAAADCYIGATEESNSQKTYGGAHVIEKLINNEKISLEVKSKGTDCYPLKELFRHISQDDLNDFFLFNPRNCYQNYAVATNSSEKTLYTYMGKLLPQYGNATFSTSGQMSPLLKDPELLTIKPGTKVFLGGGTGFIAYRGTQFSSKSQANSYGIPVFPSRTLALIGNAKKMSSSFIKAAYLKNYGVTLFVGVGIPIPVLSEEVAFHASRSNKQITTVIKDYGKEGKPVIGEIDYETLFKNQLILSSKKIPASSMSGIKMASLICEILADRIRNGSFLLSCYEDDFEYETNGIQLVNENCMQNLPCVECGLCIGYCNKGALVQVDSSIRFYKDKCDSCMLCDDVCPFGLLPYEVFDKERVYYGSKIL